MIHLGRHSYTGNVEERFTPVVFVGNFTSIASDVTFYGTCQHPQTATVFPFADKGWSDEYPKSFSRGQITIGSDVWIGEHVLILDGVSIADGAIIGAGSVIASDVPPYAVMVGNPARVAKLRFDPQTIVKLCKTKWWNKSDEEIKPLIPYMTNIEEFITRI